MTTIHYPKQSPAMESENAKGVWCGPDHVVDYSARRSGLVYDYGAKRIETHKVEAGEARGELHTTNVPGLIGITEFGTASLYDCKSVKIAVTTWFQDEKPLFEVTEYFVGTDAPHYTEIKTF